MGQRCPPFFMATTIKVDGTLATNTWQDDQLLDCYDDVDYFVPATNLTDGYVPQSQAGKGADTKGGAKSTDKIK